MSEATSSADATQVLEHVPAERAALQRIATLVARQIEPRELFAVVAEEVGRVVDAPVVAVARYDSEHTATVCGTFPTEGPPYETGARVSLDGVSVLARILANGAPARIDDNSELPGEIAESARANDISSEVGVPIVVGGDVWGSIVAWSGERLPDDFEARLGEFTELLAAAISNAEATQALAQLADEQAALRRVATLVAEGAPPADVFEAVSVEIDGLLRLARDSARVCIVRFDPGPEHCVVGVSRTIEAIPLGSRWPTLDLYAPTRVRRTGRSARVGEDDLAAACGPDADFLRENGYLSQVSSPIIVDGQVWGAISANSAAPLPPDTEQRLEKFIELIATSIANTESRDDLARLAAEQAALRRVATLVAEGAPSSTLGAVVVEELVQALGAPSAWLARYEHGDRISIAASINDAGFPVGSSWPLEGESVAARVYETGEPARIDDYSALPGDIAARTRESGVTSAAAAPVMVDGTAWGVFCVATNGPEPLPADMVDRLVAFGDLVATAISNADARDHLSGLADEQAALRRVATLVAEGATTTRLAASVLDEVVAVLDAPAAWLVRYEAGRTMSILGAVNDPSFPIGSRWPLEGTSVSSRIFETGRSARIDDFTALEGAIAARSRESGFLSSLGVPIVVDGTVWGAICVGTTASEPLPPGTEDRLERFTELIATAISNADARDHLSGLAEEQAALRRVATLVAHDASAAKVMEAVAAEVGELLDANLTVLGRYDNDGAATALGSWSSTPEVIPVGTRSAIGGRNVLSIVAETGKPARLDDYEDATGEAAEIARAFGWRSSIAAPITVEDRVWGVMLVATQRERPFPAGDEERLAQFTDLVATAVGNAQSHDAVRQFGQEQAALGRVATLVAGGAAPEQVFTAVVAEASSLLELERIELVRYDGDTTGTVMAASGEHPFPAGSAWSLDDPSVMAAVARTGSAARIDDYSTLEGEIAHAARDAGFRSAIGAPVTVEGRLWGVVIAISTDPEPIPERSETRLGQFTELVATAVANAEARQALSRLADEQAALRRVATLVASGTRPEQLFGAVAQEVNNVFGPEIAAVVKFESDGTVITLGAYGGPNAAGARENLTPDFVVGTVLATRRAARFDTDDPTAPDMPAVVRETGCVSAVASPIVVEGELWGVIVVGSLRCALPTGLEGRLGDFTDLVATAVANAEARQALERVAAEQATLRRIAMLVAEGAKPEEVFAAVAEETAATFGAYTGVIRFEDDPPGVVLVGISKEFAIPIETRWELAHGMATTEVYRTGRSARLSRDQGAWLPDDEPAAQARRLGIVSSVASPISVEGRPWGVIAVNALEELPPDTEQRLEKFTELVAMAIADAEGKSELAASRRRIVTAADEARRRIERDLHDGIQQRLIALTFRTRAMSRKPAEELPAAAAELSEGLKDVVEELREVSRGIHPTILTEAGLGPALRALARRSDIPIHTDVRIHKRLPAPVEAAAYYVASEALTNVAKHSEASVVELTAVQRRGLLTLEVRDDGVGGVDPDRGSGIVGLMDRVEALGGTISITSPPRGGTTLSVRLPITT